LRVVIAPTVKPWAEKTIPHRAGGGGEMRPVPIELQQFELPRPLHRIRPAVHV
jgi:hypothetical protein